MTGHRRPSLAELRVKAHKGRHREIGNWLARRVARPSAIYGTWAAIRLGLSAHQVTLGATLAGIGSAVAIGSGTRLGFVVGVLLAHLSFWLDHVDGQVARWRGTAGLDGIYLDYLMHHASGLALGFALGHGLALRSGDPTWSVAGFAIAFGWSFLSLQNDCRYKAFVQRLKAASGSYRVDGGAGGRPSPPPPWPRRGLGLLTWPAYKACEGHVVLLGLTGLAGLSLIDPDLWLLSYRWGVRVMAVLAPTLAVARIAKTVAAGAVEAEFARWFRPIDAVDFGKDAGGTRSGIRDLASSGTGRYVISMSTVAEIEAAIRKLADEDLVALRAWFAEFDASAWDRQFERDVADGRLDALADEALQDWRGGRCTDL